MEADAWARAKGLSQWHGQNLPRQVREFTRRGELFIRRADGRANDRLEAMMVLQGSPDHYWERPDDGAALYVHKLVVPLDLRGMGLGARCLHWGEERARASGRKFMRLDCLASNPKLRAYYPKHGYRPMGEVFSEQFQIRMALFEKDL